MSDPKGRPLRPDPDRDVVRTLELEDPITCYKQQVTELGFIKPLAKHLRKTDEYQNQPVAQQMALIGELADLPIQAVERLSIVDFERAVKITESFFGTAGGAAAASPSRDTGGEDS